MKDTKNITIGILAVTAVVLSVLLAGSFLMPQVGYADTPVKEGDYIMGTGAWSGARDLLYIIDIAARRINVYTANPNTNAIDLIDSTDLERAFAR